MRRSKFVPSLLVSALIVPTTFLGTSVASASPDNYEDPAENVDKILAPTQNDSLFETTLLLEEAGLLGARSDIASLISSSRLTDDGALELHYFASSPRAGEVEKIIASMREDLPMEVRITPVDFDPVALEKLAERLSRGEDADLQLLDTKEVTSVKVDGVTGELIVTVASTSVPEPTVIEGVPITFEGMWSFKSKAGMQIGRLGQAVCS